MNKIITKIISFVLRHSLFVTVTAVILTLSALFFIPKISIDTSIEAFFDKQSKSYVDFENWKDEFGSDDVLVVAFSDEDIFTEENLNLISRLTSEFGAVKYVDKVTSLASVNDIIGYESDFVVEPLIISVPHKPEQLLELKNRVLGNPLYTKNVISEDGKTAAILVELEDAEDPDKFYKKRALEEIYGILNSAPANIKEYYVAGPAAIEFFYTSYMRDDLKIFFPLVFAVIITVLFLSFRNTAGLVLSISGVISSLVLSMAFFYFCGFSINNVTTIIPPILIAIILADTIHLVAEGIHSKKIEEKTAKKRKDLIAVSIGNIAGPCFLTTLTTAVGFFSLTVSRVPPVKELGIVVGAGVLIAFFVTFVFIPALAKRISFLESQDASSAKTAQESGFFQGKADNLFIKLGYFSERFRYAILIAVIFIGGLSLWGLSKIKTETSVLEYFKPKSSIYKATEFIENNLSGVHLLNVSIKADEKDYFKNPGALKTVESLQEFLGTLSSVDKTISIVDYLKEINKSFNDENEQFYRIPSSKEMVAQYLLLYGEDDLYDYSNLNWDWTTVRIRLKEHSTIKLKKVINEINGYLKKNFWGGVSAASLGQTVLEVDSNEAVTKGQIKSMAIAMAVIFIMMFFVFKSFSAGMISIIINALPILVNLAVMGALGIRLNSATSMISAIGIGIIVDDTIHFLYSFKHNLLKTQDYSAAVRRSLVLKARPIIITSVVLFCGFGVVVFSRFVPTFYFGLLSALLMFNALWADLIVLPALLLIFKPKFRN